MMKVSQLFFDDISSLVDKFTQKISYTSLAFALAQNNISVI